MLSQIEGKKINQLDYNQLQKDIKETNEPDIVKNNRLNHLDIALNAELPGIPDETWRRTDLSRLKINDYIISKPLIKVKSKNLNSLISKGLVVQDIKEIDNENAKYLEKLISKIENRYIYWKDKHYSSNIDKTKFLAMSESLFKEAVFIKVPASLKIEDIVNIEVTNNTENGMIFPQIFIYLEKEASINIMIEYNSGGDYQGLSLGTMKSYIEESADLNILSYQNYNHNTLSFHNEFIMLETKAKTRYDNISIGSKTSIWENIYTLTDKFSEINVNKLISTKNRQFIGNKIFTEHFSPYTNSDVKVKSALNDKSKSLFLGKIIMPKMAQKCNGYETSDNLILGKKAMAYVIPQLEIIADDVACSHGGTVGSIDNEQLFYLTSRGIDKELAEKLIIKAFYQDILDSIIILKKDPEINNYILNQLTEKLDIDFTKEEL
jgi:Fe-S cluster assembly protein SufD